MCRGYRRKSLPWRKTQKARRANLTGFQEYFGQGCADGAIRAQQSRTDNTFAMQFDDQLVAGLDLQHFQGLTGG